MSPDHVQEGDVVKLVAGGPDMIAKRVTGSQVHCEWDEHGKQFARPFAAKLLRPAGTAR